jgi:hypothetical protein
MRQLERYTINFAQRTDPGGTHEKPKLLQITSGERSEESVIYHMKIGQLYQQMHINKVNNGTVNLNCISPYCKATAKVRVNPRFIQTFPNFYKKSNGKFRSKFALDLTNPELRNLNNWEVLYHPPKFTHGPACTTFFKSHQCNFREDMTKNSFRTGKPEYNMNKSLWNCDGANVDSIIGVFKERENI